MGKFDVQSLLKVLQGDGVATLSEATKSDEAKVNSVLTNALPLLVGKMSDNASTKEGAASLNKALNEHKTGDTIDVASFLQTADSKDGEKILDHILGSDKEAATKALSKKSGLSSKKVSSILSLVAPLLLSQVGNNKKDDDESALGGLLGGMLGSSSSSSPAASAARFSAICSAVRPPRPPVSAERFSAICSAARMRRRKKRKNPPVSADCSAGSWAARKIKRKRRTIPVCSADSARSRWGCSATATR